MDRSLAATLLYRSFQKELSIIHSETHIIVVSRIKHTRTDTSVGRSIKHRLLDNFARWRGLIDRGAMHCCRFRYRRRSLLQRLQIDGRSFNDHFFGGDHHFVICMFCERGIALISDDLNRVVFGRLSIVELQAPH
uniref:Uncharacterized protein n=1 Tax=Romanomermis culicivorax TaxID=13658 RepID=A0A915KBI0_ROMCU